MKLKRSSLQCTLNFCCCCFQLFGFFCLLIVVFCCFSQCCCFWGCCRFGFSCSVLVVVGFQFVLFYFGCVCICMFCLLFFMGGGGGGGGIIKGGQKLEKDNDILEAWRTCRNAAGTDPPSQNQYFSLTLDNPKLYTSLPDITVGSHQ